MNDATRILRERARELARPRVAEASVATTDVLEFVLAETRFAVPLRYARAVLALDHLTAIPGVPAYVAGIAHVRGEMLAVLDARSLFGLEHAGIANYTNVVVLADDAMTFGILADSVAGVRTIEDDSLGEPAERLLGVTDDGLAVIDAQSLLRDPSLVVNEERA